MRDRWLPSLYVQTCCTPPYLVTLTTIYVTSVKIVSYICCQLAIFTLERGEWSAARPGPTSPPGKTRYPLYMRLGGPQVRSGRAENFVHTGIRSRTVQPVVSRYTELATRSTILQMYYS